MNYPSVKKARVIILMVLVLNLLFRIFIYYGSNLFYFSDYKAYLGAIDNIAGGGKQYLLNGNFIFTISYIGYFARDILGNISWFFLFNCLLGTLSSLLICYLVIRLSGSYLAGIITVILHTVYTEFMVFSSVFYTPVIMIFLLSLFMVLLYKYMEAGSILKISLLALAISMVFLLTFFFKPELMYLPFFLLIASLLIFKRNKESAIKILLLSFLLFTFSFLLRYSGIITSPPGNTISNAFVFFGHTDYGGDGGEGSFVYPVNKARYDSALTKYLDDQKISNPGTKEINAFQRKEIKDFITHHPLKWVRLQFTKFFRTFGVVPETTSFKVLYTGLLKDKLWLTAFFVVAPVAIFILLFIAFFDLQLLKRLFYQLPATDYRLPVTDYRLPPPVGHKPQAANPPYENSAFLLIYLAIFVYYIIATIFYGQYQERYRMPVMVVFILPLLACFIVAFTSKKYVARRSMMIRSILVLLFLIIWIFQAEKAISNKGRLENAMESIRYVTK